ncbi:MAG: hypothetical protein CVV22_07835 [Ignavibacteriae bacterium HGW-Ignavibacteriae-1]|jgi:hypothetical protein|nr:MAG: hypothetical protein CVV22_07835 [Ignavibacteriae bacterium HGW-Ignavibacteriae-1]
MLKYIITILTILLINASVSEAQFSGDIKVALGLTTTSILGDNPAKLPMVPMTDEEDAMTGGAMRHAQPGIEFRVTMPIDEKQIYYVPFSFEYAFFTGRERINRSQFIVDIWTHSFDLVSLSSGLYVNFYKMDFANAQIYGGLEGRLSFIRKIDTRASRDFLENIQPDEIWIVPPKEKASRIGGTFRLGVEGKLIEILHVNAGFAVSAINLIGKDNERGELFTPIKDLETQESTVTTLQVFILLQLNL